VHEPNLYAWKVLREDLLSAARISPKTGEMVFPQDVAAREKWTQKREQEKRARAAALAAPPPKREAVFIPNPARAVEPRPIKPAPGIERPAAPSLNLRGPFRCEDCGTETLDWSSASPTMGTCVCRNCTIKRHRQKRDDLAPGR
jgi:hypothetical protein